ncbi:methionine synthase [Antrihabitans cavernicola]|uniref:Methionine synthase n=1 Tax=Antrihabitans cavernicola TaxID=2495913 RepID=A0A5A7SIF4_9NOCA|nr:methionine synthase [Spelaeibacter cavernicola]KAA0024383.1 methionine synthase [Spelaeibacter cavernicola]
MPDALVGVATGVGSWPGTDPREAAEIVVGELGRLPHLVELPARGVGADMIGRASALLVELPFDTTTRGYRITARPGVAAKRANELLRRDLDALEEVWETQGLSGTGTVKVQSCGPLTLAAEVELVNGHRAITDAGALRDFADSLAEGLTRHVAEVRRRLGADVVVQLDEPLLGKVLAGSLRGVTGMERVPAMPAPEAQSLLDGVITGIGAPVVVHSCAKAPPLDFLQRSSAIAVSIDATLLTARDLDGVGELLQAGQGLLLGLVPSIAPSKPPTWRDVAEPALALLDRLGFPRSILRSQIAVTPTCGLAGASDAWARTAVRLAAETARAFSEEPESIARLGQD